MSGLSASFLRVRHDDYGRSIDTALAPDLIYGLDIETDTTRGGLDPREAPIVAVALCGAGWTSVFDGDERAILTALDDAIAALPPGVLVTWNGSRFDLPFLSDRARTNGMTLGLRLTIDPHHRSSRDPLPGHAGGYLACWHEQRHLDAYIVYRADVGASLGLPCGLKPLSRFLGFSPVEVDRTAIHELSAKELEDYVASDAILTRELALRRWMTASRAIDNLG
ncbi:MAG: hypothetical protein ACI81L_002028 [Verrucomicrobiales bacterium]|jgi:hypothetical protein